MGLPIIATKITSHERILQPGENSILVNSEDTEEMAAAIERLSRNDQLREKMGTQARKSAIEHDWKHRFEQIKQTITETLRN